MQTVSTKGHNMAKNKKKFHSQANGMIDAMSVPTECVFKQWAKPDYRSYGKIDDTMNAMSKQTKGDMRFKVTPEDERY